jgi:hypothetical protein
MFLGAEIKTEDSSSSDNDESSSEESALEYGDDVRVEDVGWRSIEVRRFIWKSWAAKLKDDAIIYSHQVGFLPTPVDRGEDFFDWAVERGMGDSDWMPHLQGDYLLNEDQAQSAFRTFCHKTMDHNLLSERRLTLFGELQRIS